MRSWLFRNRLRLRAIYGPRTAPASADPAPRTGVGSARPPVRARTTVERRGGHTILRSRA